MIKILNKNTNKSIEFNLETYLLNEKDLGQIGADHFTTKSLGQMGEYLTGTSLESRDISLTGYIKAHNKPEMETRKKDLIDLINPLHEMQVIKDNHKLDCKATSSIKFSTDYKDNNDYLCKFMVEYFCSNPFWTKVNESRRDIALWIPSFRFPLTIPQEKPIIMGYRSPSTIVNIENNGNVEIGMRIEFKALGTVVNPSLLNVNTQELLKIEKILTVDEVITVNTNFGKKRVTQKLNGIESNAFPYLKRGSIFLQLNPGSNLFRYDADDYVDNLEVSVYYNPLYLEVS